LLRGVVFLTPLSTMKKRNKTEAAMRVRETNPSTPPERL
jgi:hypothetical protein